MGRACNMVRRVVVAVGCEEGRDNRLMVERNAEGGNDFTLGTKRMHSKG